MGDELDMRRVELRKALTVWRDGGGSVVDVVAAIERLIGEVIIYFAKAIARASVAASRTSCWFLRHPRHPHWRVVAEIDDHVRSLASSTGGRSLHRQRPFLVSQREHISPRGFAAMLRRNVQSAFYRERARLISGPDFGNVHFETRRDLGGVKADARLPINPLDDGETR